MDDRIAELEARLMLTDDLLDELNMTVFRQQEQIDALRNQVRALAERLQSLPTGAASTDLRDEIPPHW